MAELTIEQERAIAMANARRRMAEAGAQGSEEMSTGLRGQIDAFGRGIADAVTFGFSDEISAGLGALTGLGGDFGDYEGNLARQRRADRWDEEHNTAGRIGGQVAGAIGTGVGAAARGLTIAGRATSLPGRIAAGALEGAAYGGAYGAGSGEGLKNRIEEGITGAGGGAVLGGAFEAAAPIVRGMLSRGARVIDPATGGLTPGAAKALNDAGIDPATIGPDMLQRFEASAKTAGITPATARSAAAEEFGVPLTAGEAADDIGGVAFEEAARNYGRGKAAGDIMRSFDDTRSAAVEAAKDRMRQQFGGAVADTTSPIAAAETVTGGLRERARAAKAGVDAAYAASRRNDATISAEAVRRLPQGIRASLEAAAIPIDDLTPAARGALADIDKLAQFRGPGAPEDVVAVSLQGIDRTRRILRSRYSAAANDTDRRAVTVITKMLDGWLDDAVDNALFTGDETALDALKKARAARADFGRKFEAAGPGDDAGGVIEKMIERDVTASEVANWLYGASKVGERGLSYRLAKRLEAAFGKNSPEWGAIRQGAWQKLVSRPDGATQWGPQRISERIIDFTSGSGQGLARALFSADEVNQMRRFAGVLKMTVPDPKATNPSKTSYGVARLVGDAWSSLAASLGFAAGGVAGGAAAKGAVDLGLGLRNALRASRAAGGVRPAPRGGFAATGGFAGGALADDADNPLQFRF